MVPVVSIIVPLTLGIALAPNIPATTAEVVTGSNTEAGTGTGVASAGISNLSREELIKSMEEMKLQVLELER